MKSIITMIIIATAWAAIGLASDAVTDIKSQNATRTSILDQL